MVVWVTRGAVTSRRQVEHRAPIGQMPPNLAKVVLDLAIFDRSVAVCGELVVPDQLRKLVLKEYRSPADRYSKLKGQGRGRRDSLLLCPIRPCPCPCSGPLQHPPRFHLHHRPLSQPSLWTSSPRTCTTFRRDVRRETYPCYTSVMAHKVSSASTWVSVEPCGGTFQPLSGRQSSGPLPVRPWPLSYSSGRDIPGLRRPLHPLRLCCSVPPPLHGPNGVFQHHHELP